MYLHVVVCWLNSWKPWITSCRTFGYPWLPIANVVCCARPLLRLSSDEYCHACASCDVLLFWCCARLHGLTIPWKSGGAEIVATSWQLMLLLTTTTTTTTHVVYIIFSMRVEYECGGTKKVTLGRGTQGSIRSDPTQGSMILAVCLLPLAAHVCL